MTLREKNLNLLPILLALLEEESVIGAARRVHLSQPAVSGVLSRLREEFDDPLLVRVGRQMQRTNRAERLLPQIKQSCAELERLFDFGVFDPAQSQEKFILAAPDHLAFPITRELVPLLAAEAPAVEVRIVDTPADLPHHLTVGTIDLGVAGNFGVWPELSYESVITEGFVAAMASDHPLADQPHLTVDQVSQYNSVSRVPQRLAYPTSGPMTTGVAILDLAGQIAVEQYVTAVLLVVETPLIIPAPKMLVNTLGRHLPIVGIPFDQDYSVEAGLFWAPFKDDSPEITWLRSVVARCLRVANTSE